VHTSTKARLTSVMIHIQIRIRIQIHHLDCHQNLIICSMVHCQPFLKISRKSIWKFLHKVANKQTTDKQRQKHIFLGGGNYKNWIHYSLTLYISIIAFSALMLIAGWQERHLACKNFVVRYWHHYLSAEVQMLCIWSSWCHCHPIISYSSKIQNGLPFWCRLTQVVLEKRPLNRCSSSVVLIYLQVWYPAGKKVKASYTRYRALGLELIPVYRQSACRWP